VLTGNHRERTTQINIDLPVSLLSHCIGQQTKFIGTTGKNLRNQVSNRIRFRFYIPEITLVAILDADKEGFLRSETSLIQTIGRAARNAEGHVIMYADTITDSMRAAIDETNRRREIQQKYNEEHGITPQTIKKAVRDLIAISKAVSANEEEFKKDPESMDARELEKLAKELTKKMRQAAAELNFEEAAKLRDRMKEVKQMLLELEDH